MQLEETLKSGRIAILFERVPVAWRTPIAVLTASILILILATLREWGEMFHQWWNIDTYTHILLVPFVVAWLVWLKAEELAKLTPRPWLPGLGLVAAGLSLWLIGRLSEINLFAHAGAVGAAQGAIIAILGLRTSLILALPIAMMVFLVPFGDELIPALQGVTAEIAILLTLASGIEAVVDGIFIDTPVGLFIVAEACSGVKFLIAMVTLAVLVCFTRFQSWTRRAGFLAAAIIVPILANGVRAWGTIYIAQSQGVEFAAGFDHIFYGWIFFAIVVAVLLAGAWRFFECEPEDYGWSPSELARWSWLEKAEGETAPRFTLAMAAIATLVFVSVMVNAIAAPAALG